jgi:hypothetical protein
MAGDLIWQLDRAHLPGVITKCYMASMNDWPEFAMRSESAEDTSWSRFGHFRGDDRYYKVGRCVEVDYVLQSSEVKLPVTAANGKTVVEVRIEIPPETIRERVVRHRVTGDW